MTNGIARPPFTWLGKRIESQTRKALHTFGMVEGVNKLAIALSGGKDSLTLLFMLKAISGRGFPPFEIICIHVQGEVSCGASIGQTFLKDICDALEVPLIIRESQKKFEDLECYSCSRERRRLLFDAAKESGCTHVAFGHHKDDSAETLMMNLLHKAEFSSLLPKLEMVDFGITICRPLIFVNESDIIAFSKLYGFNRITCRCPIGARSIRKKTEELIVEMERIYPNARHNLAQAAINYGSKKAETRGKRRADKTTLGARKENHD